MKNLILTLSLTLGLATSVFAKDIKMQCDWDYSTKYFKYSDKIFKDKVYKRDDGQWLDLCVGMLAMV